MHALDGMSQRNCFIRLLRTAKICPICSFNKSRGPYGIANIPLTEMHIKRTGVLPFFGSVGSFFNPFLSRYDYSHDLLDL